MRVIAGRFRSRQLKSVPGLQVRPTPDRLRESLFSILMPRLEGAVFFDIYAGSGAVGIEALSRGAVHAVLIEKDRQALAVVRENLQTLGLENEATVVRGPAMAVLAGAMENRRPDIAFLDPPYEKTAEYEGVLGQLGSAAVPSVIAQHPSRLKLREEYGQLRRVRVLKQGDNSLSFYEPARLTSEQQMNVHDVGAGGTGSE